MPKRRRDSTLSRRGILKGATVVGVAAVGSSFDVKAQMPAQLRPAGPVTPAPRPIVESGRLRHQAAIGLLTAFKVSAAKVRHVCYI